MTAWFEGLKTFRALTLMIDRGIGNEILATVEGYAAALAKAGKTIPPEYALGQFVHLQMTHTPEVTEAARLMAKAAQHANNSEYPEAQSQLEESMKLWRALLDRHPSLLMGSDPIVTRQISETIAVYRRVLELRGKELPDDFPLKDFAEKEEKKA